MDVDQLAPGEPLSPELVLVLPPELRARVLADLGPPARPAPRLRAAPPAIPAAPPAIPAADPPLLWSFGQLLLARVVQLSLIFVAVTVLTLAMSIAAHAFR